MHHQISPTTTTTTTISLLLLISLPFLKPQFSNAQNSTIQCPLDFTILTTLAQPSTFLTTTNLTTRCQYLRQAARLVLSNHLRLTNSFVPPFNSSQSCWNSYQLWVNQFVTNFDIITSCGFRTTWLVQGCMDITTKDEFEARVVPFALESVRFSCNQSLNTVVCGPCIVSIVNLQASSLSGESNGNISDCGAYAWMYGAGIVNPYGPTDPGTADCLFKLDLSKSEESNSEKKKVLIVVCVVGFVVIVVLGLVVVWFLKRKRKRGEIGESGSFNGVSGLELISENSSLVKFSFDAIKAATGNFATENIIGTGGYGNVYRGVLKDGTEVALKRFKNLSAAGDATFAHELEVIASVRHVNLVALRGYCTGTSELEGHQRIIVYDLMKNGSLYDHLFMSRGKKLSWPVRAKIAFGTAQGLAYLHNGVQPGIIHRDIKASNILLDEKFEAKVADFGLAKFAPQGMTHLSTKLAGTMGYVAPEYALYGQVSERSDVYSFGVVLLQLLSGRKAIIAANDGELVLLSDWVWSLVKEGRTLDVIEEDMVDLDLPEVMENYILIAILCSHPQLYARPSMSDVVKLLENSIPVPAIPDRPNPFVVGSQENEKSTTSVVSATTLFLSFTDERS
ncbi:hypothetical protein LIER_35349 [Lithospermum erythrorhizon]|uniref:non-specific serine/threonine protein kinase n=1 Tax=Lithospermum erythrorhizon TaxID=34254 RepID=A0AAV3NPB0_LITER